MRTRNNLIQIWLSDDELQKLHEKVEKCGLSRAAFLRQLIRGCTPKELPPLDYYAMMRQLYYCGNNLNQIARKAHALGVIDAQRYDDTVRVFQETVKEVKQTFADKEK
jgi:hypothetical protein